MPPSLFFLLAIVVAFASIGLFAYFKCQSDIRKARSAINAYETIKVDTTYGDVELVDQGKGFPILSIHGTGGGFDQGLALAAVFRAKGYRVIAPSRFGYPGASIPDRHDAVAQADAFKQVLDQLTVEQAIVMGASADAVTALHFAASSGCAVGSGAKRARPSNMAMVFSPIGSRRHLRRPGASGIPRIRERIVRDLVFDVTDYSIPVD